MQSILQAFACLNCITFVGILTLTRQLRISIYKARRIELLWVHKVLYSVLQIQWTHAYTFLRKLDEIRIWVAESLCCRRLPVSTIYRCIFNGLKIRWSRFERTNYFTCMVNKSQCYKMKYCIDFALQILYRFLLWLQLCFQRRSLSLVRLRGV